MKRFFMEVKYWMEDHEEVVDTIIGFLTAVMVGTILALILARIAIWAR